MRTEEKGRGEEKGREGKSEEGRGKDRKGGMRREGRHVSLFSVTVISTTKEKFIWAYSSRRISTHCHCDGEVWQQAGIAAGEAS